MTITRDEIARQLGEYLASDFEHGPFSDTPPFVWAAVEQDGMLSLYKSDHPNAWPEASFDVPQLAEWLMPLVRRAQAEALRELASDLDRYAGTILNAESAANIARVNASGIEQNSEGNET